MSDKFGRVYFARERKSRFLDLGPEGAAEYSAATAELIDNEVKDIIDMQYSKALDILRKSLSVPDKGAELLLSKEKIEGNEIKALLQEAQNA